MLQEELANTMMHLKEESKAGCVLVQPSPTTCDPYDGPQRQVGLFFFLSPGVTFVCWWVT